MPGDLYIGWHSSLGLQRPGASDFDVDTRRLHPVNQAKHTLEVPGISTVSGVGVRVGKTSHRAASSKTVLYSTAVNPRDVALDGGRACSDDSHSEVRSIVVVAVIQVRTHMHRRPTCIIGPPA